MEQIYLTGQFLVDHIMVRRLVVLLVKRQCVIRIKWQRHVVIARGWLRGEQALADLVCLRPRRLKLTHGLQDVLGHVGRHIQYMMLLHFYHSQ